MTDASFSVIIMSQEILSDSRSPSFDQIPTILIYFVLCINQTLPQSVYNALMFYND